MRSILYLIIGFGTLLSCTQNDCSSLPSAFESYDQAESMIRSAQYQYTDTKRTSSSSWIRKAEFYSCDREQGYFLYTTKSGKTYVHAEVPRSIWNGFKEADSHGGFYNRYIKVEMPQ